MTDNLQSLKGIANSSSDVGSLMLFVEFNYDPRISVLNSPISL